MPAFSLRLNSLVWTRVHDLPDFASFNHSVHVTKNVGCETCHGRLAEAEKADVQQ